MKRRITYIILSTIIYLTSCQKQEVVDFIDPMIGTDGIGHTFPGATSPFGMVQLSPSNDFKGWNWCSGYHYSDSTIKGFAHTHISGAGLAAMGDILVMPMMGNPTTNAGSESNTKEGYRSRFSHDTEEAKAGYYKVTLEDENIDVELTASTRVGWHQYTFNEKGEAHIVFDPTHHIMETVSETALKFEDNNTVSGYKEADGEAGKRKIYFYAQFSKPFKSHRITAQNEPIEDISEEKGKKIKGYVTFDVENGEALILKVGISHVSLEGAKQNYLSETKNKTFDLVKEETKNLWQEKLASIEVEMDNDADLKVFYTGMYHAYISPNIINDIDGHFIVEGKKYHTNYPQFSNYSTWDTYRALNPLFTIIEEKGTAEIVNSLVSRETVSNVGLPVWESAGHDNVCMIGYNAVSPIADAILKDIHGINYQEAYKVIAGAANSLEKHSPNYDVNGMSDYLRFHYVPAEIGASVSKTTEYNYFDWTIAQVAQKLGKEEDRNYYLQRSKGYQNLYDPKSHYLLPKRSDGQEVQLGFETWDDLTKNYISGNIWGYTMYVPHDMEAYISLMGGKDTFAQKLDEILSDTTHIGGAEHVDISGFIGKYAHGDEPSHHIPYLYTYVGKSWRTQELVHQVMNEFYSAEADGLINNEDLGQMSAWYIFSAMGFYPVCPGDLTYVIGSPKVKSASIHLENGKTFKVEVENFAPENIYIQAIKWNEQPYEKTFITHEMVKSGGTLVFEMGNQPSKTFGMAEENFPFVQKNDISGMTPKEEVVKTPIAETTTNFFAGKQKVKLYSKTEGAQIHYTIDGTTPTKNAPLYKNGINLSKTATIKAKAFKKGMLESNLMERKYINSLVAGLKEGYPKIDLLTKNNDYGAADGSQLIDMKIGSNVFSDGNWTGFIDENLEAVIDLGAKYTVSTVKFNAMSNTYVWIFPPKKVIVYAGNSKGTLKKIKEQEFSTLTEHENNIIEYSISLPSIKTRYIKVEIENYGPMPDWHGGTGQRPFLLVDEIYIQQ